MAVAVRDNPEGQRYEATVDGALAGFAIYRSRPGLIAFMHTEVDDAFEGQGVGSTLVRDALEDVRRRGLEVLPFCPFRERLDPAAPGVLGPGARISKGGLRPVRKTYDGMDVDVSFDPEVCIHARRCIEGLPAVFDVKRKPWILPDGAAADAVVEQVRRCPSGALQYERHKPSE